MYMYSSRWSRTFIVFQVMPTLFNPCERLSAHFTEETFYITVFSFMGAHVSRIWIFVGALITFELGFTMIE